MLRIIQITDTHLRAEPGGRLRGCDVDAGLDAVLDHARRHHWPADLVLATGDLVHEEPAAYPRLRETLSSLTVPVYCLPGNHDVAAFADALASGPVRRERRVIAEPWQILLLDSTIPGEDGGRLQAAELDFLQAQLSTHPTLYALVCLHHHPLPTGIDWLDTTQLANADELFAMLDRHPRVRGVLWGHIHRPFSARRNGVELLGTPSSCCQFVTDPATDINRPGYRWLQLHPDGTLRSAVVWTDVVGS